jgi:hypothetical protein
MGKDEYKRLLPMNKLAKNVKEIDLFFVNGFYF